MYENEEGKIFLCYKHDGSNLERSFERILKGNFKGKVILNIPEFNNTMNLFESYQTMIKCNNQHTFPSTSSICTLKFDSFMKFFP
jgi:hypothetical protein